MVVFYIDEKITGRVGLNKMYAGMNWRDRKELVDYWHMLTYASMSQCKVPRTILQHRVEIEIYVDSALDIDNHGALAKLIIDGMCDYILEDDSRGYIYSYKVMFYKGGDRIKVVVRELPDEEIPIKKIPRKKKPRKK
jgi:hypothetical protein